MRKAKTVHVFREPAGGVSRWRTQPFHFSSSRRGAGRPVPYIVLKSGRRSPAIWVATRNDNLSSRNRGGKGFFYRPVFPMSYGRGFRFAAGAPRNLMSYCRLISSRRQAMRFPSGSSWLPANGLRGPARLLRGLPLRNCAIVRSKSLQSSPQPPASGRIRLRPQREARPAPQEP